MQWRCAIGCFNSFVKSKENLELYKLSCLLKKLGPYGMIVLINLPLKYTVMMMLLLMCGDVKPNPGPVKFCHLNARSILAGV